MYYARKINLPNYLKKKFNSETIIYQIISVSEISWELNQKPNFRIGNHFNIPLLKRERARTVQTPLHWTAHNLQTFSSLYKSIENWENLSRNIPGVYTRGRVFAARARTRVRGANISLHRGRPSSRFPSDNLLLRKSLNSVMNVTQAEMRRKCDFYWKGVAIATLT